jgi:MFS family permease
VLSRYVRLVAMSAVVLMLASPNSIMSGVIIKSMVPRGNVRTVALWQLYLALMPVPGVLIGAWLVNKIGRRWTGIFGLLAGYVVCGFIIGGLYDKLATESLPAFAVLYGLLQAFGHMGPGATIGLISCESFPTAARGMGYGIAAGFGKAGAAVGTQVFTPLRESAGPSSTFYLAGGIGLLTSVIYYYLPEGRGVDLEREDEEFERLVAENER